MTYLYDGTNCKSCAIKDRVADLRAVQKEAAEIIRNLHDFSSRPMKCSHADIYESACERAIDWLQGKED